MRLRKKPWIDEAVLEFKDTYIYLEDLTARRGKWHEVLGKETLAIEIGSGKGDFIVGMAELHPEIGYVGIESQLGVAYYPALKASEKQLTNVKVQCGDAAEIEEWFAPGEVDLLYLNFSDPWPKARHAKRRLTYRSFLAKYQRILRPGGHLRFKTDNKGLFDFSVEEFKEYGLEIISLSYDLHNSEYDNEVQTEYEKKFSSRGAKINFCEAVFPK